MTSLKLFRIAVEYVRVSTSLQDEMLSGDAQSFHIAPEAEKKGFRIAKRFGETGSGTSVSKRAVFLALIDYCLDPANKVEAVWFYDPSRYTRDIADFYHYIGKLTPPASRSTPSRWASTYPVTKPPRSSGDSTYSSTP